jgi:hypothetical protein
MFHDWLASDESLARSVEASEVIGCCRARVFFYFAVCHKMSFLRLAARAACVPRASWIAPRVSHQLRQQALFSSGSGLSRDVIQERVLNVFREFEKVDAAKVVPVLLMLRPNALTNHSLAHSCIVVYEGPGT